MRQPKGVAADRQSAGDRLADLDGLGAGLQAQAPVDRGGRAARLADIRAERRGDAIVEHFQILEPLGQRRQRRGEREKGQREASENWHHDSHSRHLEQPTQLPCQVGLSAGEMAMVWPAPGRAAVAHRDRDLAFAESAFAQRPPDRGGPGGGKLEAVEPAAFLAGAVALDADRMAGEARALRAESRAGLGRQQRLARLKDLGGVEGTDRRGWRLRRAATGAAAVGRCASIAWNKTKQPSSSSSMSAKLTAQRGSGRRFMRSA